MLHWNRVGRNLADEWTSEDDEKEHFLRNFVVFINVATNLRFHNAESRKVECNAIVCTYIHITYLDLHNLSTILLKSDHTSNISLSQNFPLLRSISSQLTLAEHNTLCRVADRPITIVSVGWVGKRIVCETCDLVVRQFSRLVLTCEESLHRTESICATLTFSCTDSLKWNNSVVESLTHEFVGCVGVIITILCWRIGCARVVNCRGVGGRAANDFGDEARSKGCEMR